MIAPDSGIFAPGKPHVSAIGDFPNRAFWIGCGNGLTAGARIASIVVSQARRRQLAAGDEKKARLGLFGFVYPKFEGFGAYFTPHSQTLAPP